MCKIDSTKAIYSMCLQLLNISVHLKLHSVYFKVSLVVQMVKHQPTVWETQVRSLDQEDPLEKEMATHSSTLAWKIPWTEECRRL